MSGSFLPTYRPVVLPASRAGLSTAEQVERALLIHLPTAACSKREQIDSHLRSNDELSAEKAACRPNTP